MLDDISAASIGVKVKKEIIRRVEFLASVMTLGIASAAPALPTL
jgi:hypothetical protein